MKKGLFVIGTGTEIGKTYVTGLLVKKLRESGQQAAYYKAAMSGNEQGEEGLRPGDALWVKQASGIAQPVEEMCPYVYRQAYSPHLAARLEGNPVEWDVVKAGFAAVCQRADYVTVEGSGGILCPLRVWEDGTVLWLEDVIRGLHLPCVLVADAGLGTINAVGLTAAYCKAKGIPLKGILFNRFHPGDVMEEDNRCMCEALTGLKVLACVQEGDTGLGMTGEALCALYDEISDGEGTK